MARTYTVDQVWKNIPKKYDRIINDVVVNNESNYPIQIDLKSECNYEWLEIFNETDGDYYVFASLKEMKQALKNYEYNEKCAKEQEQEEQEQQKEEPVKEEKKEANNMKAFKDMEKGEKQDVTSAKIKSVKSDLRQYVKAIYLEKSDDGKKYVSIELADNAFPTYYDMEAKKDKEIKAKTYKELFAEFERNDFLASESELLELLGNMRSKFTKLIESVDSYVLENKGWLKSWNIERIANYAQKIHNVINALEALGVEVKNKDALGIIEPKQEEKKEDNQPLSPSLVETEREQPTLKNDSQEITSLRLDLTDSERSAICCLFELEKDRRNGKEWTDKEKVQAQKALDTLTYLGILDKFPNLKDFEPDLEDFDAFKFYKSESFYKGGYLPTSQTMDFLDLIYDEIIEQDKVMSLLQIPLNVLNVTDYIEVLPCNILRVHLKQGFQYQGSSFIDSLVGEYQAFNLEDKDQIEQIQMFDLEDELEHFEEYKEQEIKQLQEALFDVDKDLDLMESIEEQTFINNYCYKKASFEDARRLAVRSAELATGTTKNALLDKRIDIGSKISVLESSLQEFKAFSSQPIKYQ